MSFTHTLLAAFTIVALLVGIATSEKDTCFNETKESDWNIYASGVNATDCNFSDVDLFVKSMVENAKKESLLKVVADITGSAIVQLQIDASSSGIDLSIPLILNVSKNTITELIRIFGNFPHGSQLTFSGNTIKTKKTNVVYNSANSLVLNKFSTLSFKENTITQMLGTALGGGDIMSLGKLTLEGGSSLVCSGNTIDMKRSTENSFYMYVLYLTDASVSNSSISVSDNTINWENNGTTKSKIFIMQFIGSNKKFFGNNISIKDNTITTVGNTSFERIWHVSEMKNYSDIAIDACGNSLNGATLYDLGQRYLYPVSLADFLVSDCPNPNNKNNNGTDKGNSGTDTSSIATTSTVVAGALTYLFVYFLF